VTTANVFNPLVTGVFKFYVSSNRVGSTSITASAVVNGIHVTSQPLRIRWFRRFNSITLAPSSQAVGVKYSAGVQATVLAFGLVPVPEVPVNFTVTFNGTVPSREENAAAVSAEEDTDSTTEPASADYYPHHDGTAAEAVLPFTKQVTTNAEGKAVLLLRNPKRHTPGTYKVVASAKPEFGSLINPCAGDMEGREP
jgi:hypothetical protein